MIIDILNKELHFHQPLWPAGTSSPLSCNGGRDFVGWRKWVAGICLVFLDLCPWGGQGLKISFL